ncbi:phosphotransferase [Desertihabitans brevis]|uniref:Phosphotransferase n=1 Tax=Desertihabitans brevis TaxID=2268447 RepID=A0A367YUK5_9ACTN|nr:aminoglycoside phosphotransferase family protein [Desertihabitans brevis]RCK68651.1 phosphotransferase [Desertihabitans brevis]
MGEIIDQGPALVRHLVESQFPAWAGLVIERGPGGGTDNHLYRLGEDKVVRLPRQARAAEVVSKEHRWLPRLAPHLPLEIPEPLGVGVPDPAFPYPWSVYRWLDGDNLLDCPSADLADTAHRLGQFVRALQSIDPTGGPTSVRARPVTPNDDTGVCATIDKLATAGLLDPTPALEVWKTALETPAWTGPPVWIHSDLYTGNLLGQHGRLSAVIDFGMLGVGDPACDLLPAWSLLTTSTREAFRAQVGVDDDTWNRGRGWALSAGLGAVAVYGDTNPTLAIPGRHAIAQTIEDWQTKNTT